MLMGMRLFVSAVELGSFSRAAIIHNLRVSSVSRHISALEQDLQAVLFRRSTREILLTDAGSAFYERAVRILAEVDDARSAASSTTAEPIGTLRLRVPIEFGRLHLTQLLPEFMATVPGLSVDVTLSDLELDLESARFDVSIRLGEPSDTRFYAHKIARNHYAICGAPSYVGRASEPKFPSALRDYNCLTHAELATWQFGSNRSTVEVAVTVVGNFRSNRLEPILQATLAGAGFSRLPYWLAGPYLKSGALIPLLANYEVKCADNAIYGIYPEKRTASPKVRAFLEFISGRIGTPPHWER